MTDPVSVKNIFETGNPMAAMIPAMMGNIGGGTGAAVGGGLGAGLLGGILGGVLLNRNGVLGGGIDGGAGCVTPAMLTSGLASVIDSNQNTTLLQSVGDVKAAVPLAEAQVQLALAGSTAQIQSTLNNNASAAALANSLTNQNIANSTATTLAGQVAINKNIADAIAASLASQSAIKETVAAYGVANLNATKDAQFAIVTAGNQNTKEILAALNQQNVDNLQRQLTVAESVGLENRLLGRQREVEVNVTQTVNQNQLQAQAQLQQQQQAVFNATIMAHLQNLQVATAANTNLIVGNTGATTTGPQTANPVNVRA